MSSKYAKGGKVPKRVVSRALAYVKSQMELGSDAKDAYREALKKHPMTELEHDRFETGLDDLKYNDPFTDSKPFAKGGLAALPKKGDKGRQARSVDAPKAKSALKSRPKRRQGVAGALRDADKTLSETGKELAQKYAKGGKTGKTKNVVQAALKHVKDQMEEGWDAKDAYRNALKKHSMTELEHDRFEAGLDDLDYNDPYAPGGKFDLENEYDSRVKPMKKAKGGLARYAEGGKVGPAVAALRRLAQKFETDLSMGDQDSARRTARQMDLLQPGSSSEAFKALQANPTRVTADKLATFAKGGKVSKITLTWLKKHPNWDLEDYHDLLHDGYTLQDIKDFWDHNPGTKGIPKGEPDNRMIPPHLLGDQNKYAKGGKVGGAKKIIKSIQLVSDPEMTVHDDLKMMLEDAKVPARRHKEVTIKKRTHVDSDGESHFHDSDIEAPEDIHEMLEKHMSASSDDWRRDTD